MRRRTGAATSSLPITTSARPTGSASATYSAQAGVVARRAYIFCHRVRAAEQGGVPLPGPNQGNGRIAL